MATLDEQFTELYQNILDNGELRPSTRMFWKDGTPAYYKSVFGGVLTLEPQDGFPITTKKVTFQKSLSSEIDWIALTMSNIVQDLRDLGSKVWDEWELPDGTIGKAYGYQMRNQKYKVGADYISTESLKAIGKDNLEELPRDADNSNLVLLNQMEYVVQQLIDNPYSRQIMTNIWTIADLSDMSLQPCVYNTQWIRMGNKLSLIVRTRSSDSFLGLPFNVAQYGVLHRLVAQTVGLHIGTMQFQLGDVHLYDRHFEPARKFIANDSHKQPEFWIDDSITSLFDHKFKTTFKILDYGKNKGNSGSIPAEICITKAELDRLS